jgi:hypothetical protein
MRGFNKEDAVPTIRVLCDNPKKIKGTLKKFKGVPDRKRIGLKIEKNSIYFTMDIQYLNPIEYRLDTPIEKNTALVQGDIVTPCLVPSSRFSITRPALGTRQATPQNIQILKPLSGTLVTAEISYGVLSSSATIGGCILLDGISYGLTVHHMTIPHMIPSWSADHNDRHSDDEGSDDGHANEATSSEDLSDWGSEDEDDQENVPRTVAENRQSTESSSYPPVSNSFFPCKTTSGTELGYLYKSSGLRTVRRSDSDYLMDWMLVMLTKDSMKLVGNEGYEATNNSMTEFGMDSLEEYEGKDVVVHTGTSGRVQGKLATPCSLWLPGQRKFSRFWRVDFKSSVRGIKRGANTLSQLLIWGG